MTAPTNVRNRQQNEGWKSVLEWLKFYCIKFFGGQQDGEIKLLAQFYNRLRAEYEKIKQDDSPFAQSISNSLNFKLTIERSTQPQPSQDFLLQP